MAHAFVIVIILKGLNVHNNFNYIFLWKKEKPNQNNIKHFKWGLFNFVAYNVTIHKQYFYGFTISKFVMMNSFINFKFFEHVINNSKQRFSKPFSRWHGSILGLFKNNYMRLYIYFYRTLFLWNLYKFPQKTFILKCLWGAHIVIFCKRWLFCPKHRHWFWHYQNTLQNIIEVSSCAF